MTVSAPSKTPVLNCNFQDVKVKIPKVHFLSKLIIRFVSGRMVVRRMVVFTRMNGCSVTVSIEQN